MTDEKKSHDHAEHKEHKKNSKKCKNCETWKMVSFVLLALVVVAGGIMMFSGTSKSSVGSVVTAYVSSNFQIESEVQSVKSYSKDLYEVVLDVEGEAVPVYVTKDGENLILGGLYPLTGEATSEPNEPTPTDVPKSDTPEVELFVWSYCPYGVTAQGPLAEVANLLEGSANFKAVMYHDGHGAYETQQNKIQECIQVTEPDKYWDYAAKFVSDVYPACSSARTEECDMEESLKAMNSVGIDSDAVLSCVDTQGTELVDAARARAQELGVQGSPTIVINGVIVNAARNADAFKDAVCGTFTTAPELCGEALSTQGAAAAGNC